MGWHTWFYRPAAMHEEESSSCSVGGYAETDYHDIFCIASEEQLHSREQTFDFIEENKGYIFFGNPKWEEQINEFWDKYPNGMIEFG